MNSNRRYITLKLKAEGDELDLSQVLDLEAIIIYEVKKELIQEDDGIFWYILIEYKDNHQVLHFRIQQEKENRNHIIMDFIEEKNVSVRVRNALMLSINTMFEDGFELDKIVKFRNLGQVSFEKYKSEISEVYHFIQNIKLNNKSPQ